MLVSVDGLEVVADVGVELSQIVPGHPGLGVFVEGIEPEAFGALIDAGVGVAEPGNRLATNPHQATNGARPIVFRQ